MARPLSGLLCFVAIWTICVSAQETAGGTKEPMDLSRVETLEDLPEEKTGVENILPPFEILFFEYICQPDNDIKNIDDTAFTLNEYRMGFNPNFEISENLYLGLGVTYNAYNFSFRFPEIDPDLTTHRGGENRTLHSLSFPLSLTLITEKWLVSGQITTSLNSDFREFDRHDSQVNGGAIVGYLLHPTLLLQLGLFATNDFGDLNVIPAGGLIWKIDPSFDISLLIPFSASINWHLNDSFTMFLHYELDGNQFRFRYRENGEVLEEDGQFTMYRIGVGAKVFVAEGVSLKLILGGTAGGRYEFRGLSAEERDGRIGGAFYALVGIALDENLFRSITRD